jgi:hypothetical protein
MVLKALVVSPQGTDKTTLAWTLIQHLKAARLKIGVDWQNADRIFEQRYALDFSGGGRLRQREEIAKIANSLLRPQSYVFRVAEQHTETWVEPIGQSLIAAI